MHGRWGEDRHGINEVALLTPGQRAVVTGAAGFIGSHLVDALLARGAEVVGIDSFTPYYAPAIKRANIAPACRHPRFQLLPARLNDVDLADVLRPGDWVFHLAAQPGVRASWGPGFVNYVRDNIEATQLLLEAARDRGVERLVYASSSSVYGDAPLPMSEDGPLRPVSPYGITKLTAEHLCTVYSGAYGLPVIPLRLFTVYGPRQRPDMAFHRFITAIADGTPVTIYGDGGQRRGFTFVSDVVEAFLGAAERGLPGVPVNVGGGSSISVMDTIRLVEEIVGRTAIVEMRPAPAGDARDTQADTRRLEALGTLPSVGLEQGLRRQVSWQTAGAGSADRHTAGPGVVGSSRTVLMYSHDSYGLGHLRRNLAIAHTMLARDPRVRVMLLSGSRVAGSWRLPERMSVVPLPPVLKTGVEDYSAGDGRTIGAVMAERSGLIAATLQRVRPEVLLVDHAPLGMKGELRLALETARDRLHKTHVVLGLRDILDDPETVRALWKRQGIHEALDTLYDEVVVYGCDRLFDVREAYALPPSVAMRTWFAGYVAKPGTLESAGGVGVGASPLWRAADRRVIVLGGGGGDAAQLFTSFLGGWAAITRVTGAHALLVTGPLMEAADQARIEATAAGLPRAEVLRFSTGILDLIGTADLVVSMGGYNSVVEAVTARKPLVICPRVHPRREQLLRAQLLENLGLASIHRLDLDEGPGLTDTVLGAWSAKPPSAEQWGAIDLGGAGRVADRVLAAAGGGGGGRYADGEATVA